MNQLPYTKNPWFHVGRASDLTGKDRVLYRLLETLPGILTWGTILGTIIASIFVPVWAAIFIITFDLFWLLKTLYLSIHLIHNHKRMQYNMELDWNKKLQNFKYEHLWHMVLLPFYNESLEVVEGTLKSLIDASYDKKRIIVVLAGEGAKEEHAKEIQAYIQKKYSHLFGFFITTIHPAGIEGEHAGKGANTSWAIDKARTEVLDANNIPYRDVIVSNFDTDTVIFPKYFSCLTWYFLDSPDPYKTSFQPVPFYNNNIWHAPAFSRVAATSGSLWQMIQQERPEKLVTFSSHSVSFQTLYEINYWQRNMVSEDSRIFWNAFMANDGNYTVTPISYPVSMDANLAPTFLQTIKNIYKQHRRWMWGAENIPYIIFNFIKNKNIPFSKKFDVLRVQIDGYWSLATNPIFILLLGWLPLMLGGSHFNKTILSYNLPTLTQYLMTISMIGILISALVAFRYLPKPPEGYNSWRRKGYMFLQWLLVPVTIIVFGAIPGIEAQTRLMFGKYMGFWVTPKHRK